MRPLVLVLVILASVGCGESAKEHNARLQRSYDETKAALDRKREQEWAIEDARIAEENAKMTEQVDQTARAMNAWIEDQNRRLDQLDPERQKEALKGWSKIIEENKRSE